MKLYFDFRSESEALSILKLQGWIDINSTSVNISDDEKEMLLKDLKLNNSFKVIQLKAKKPNFEVSTFLLNYL